MKHPVGYLINTKNGFQGEPGFIYDYIIAENGLFLRANSPLLEAQICIAPVLVRGLAPLEERIFLPKGKIPKYLYELALSVLYTDISRECYLAVTWDAGYHLKKPEQERKEAAVQYQVLEATIMDIHSHGSMPAFSSETDNQDEQGFRLSLVAGKLNEATPEIDMRLVMYGYYSPVDPEEIFECTC